MAGIQTPNGIDTVNPVPADYKYGPYANTAAAIAAIPLALRYDGLTVQITGSGNYWWLQADLTNTGLIPKTSGGGSSLPIVHQVYLVEDASDALLMGGATSNVYITAQAAYDAADVLTAGGTVPVVIMVGKTTAATVGGITLSNDWNTAISLSGINKDESKIGDIIGTNAIGFGFSVGNAFYSSFTGIVYMNDITIGNIYTNYNGVMTGAESSGNVSIFTSNSKIGNIDTSLNDPSNSGSFAGFVFINNDYFYTGVYIKGYNSIVGNINASTTSNAPLSDTLIALDDLSYVGGIDNRSAGSYASASIYCTSVSINGPVVTGNILMTKVDMSFPLNFIYTCQWNGGKMLGVITNNSSIYATLDLILQEMDYIAEIDVDYDLVSQCLIQNNLWIGVIRLDNTSGAFSQTLPCVIINTYVAQLHMANVVFSNSSLASKNLSYTILNLTKVIHRNFTSTNYTINYVGINNTINAMLNTSTLLGAYGDDSSKILTGIVIKNNTANAVTGGLNIGTSPAGSEIMLAVAVAGNANLYINDATILQRIFTAANTQIYVTAVTSWNSANLEIALLFSNFK